MIDDDDRLRIALDAGYVPATMGDTPTHAICKHGTIAAITDNHHACTWIGLVAKDVLK